jgi:hypothetical protein
MWTLGAGEGKCGGVKASTTRLRSMSEGEGEAPYRDYVVKEKRGLVWGEGGITVEGLVEVLRETRTQGVVQHCQPHPQDTRETG